MKVNTRESLEVGDMTAAMLERQPLPMGRAEFMSWSDRIIKGALVQATEESLRFSLAAMLMHLAPTEAFKEDAYFILSLRKAAVNQTAHSMMEELKEAQQKRREEKEKAEATASNLGVINGAKLLENSEVQDPKH